MKTQQSAAWISFLWRGGENRVCESGSHPSWAKQTKQELVVWTVAHTAPGFIYLTLNLLTRTVQSIQRAKPDTR